jgi:hypothetical protein
VGVLETFCKAGSGVNRYCKYLDNAGGIRFSRMGAEPTRSSPFEEFARPAVVRVSYIALAVAFLACA